MGASTTPQDVAAEVVRAVTAPQPHEGAFPGRLEDEVAGGNQPLLTAVPHPFR